MTTCEPCTYSPEPVVDFLPTSSSDIRQLSLLSGSNSNVTFLGQERQKDGFQSLKSTKVMYAYSTGPHTKEKYLAFMRASLAKICQTVESEPAWKKAREAVSTGKFSVLLGKYDPNTYSLRTCQQSFIQDLNTSWETWPRWGLMRSGAVYAHPKSAHLTLGIDGGVWLPTPLKSDHMKFLNFKLKSVLKATFGSHVNSIPYYMAAQHGRIPSQDVLTWVMGFPNGWGSLPQWEMPKFRSKQQSRGNSLGENK